MTTKREDIYDNEIAPLMSRIIATCKAHDIPIVASFQLDDERPDNDGFMCTTTIVPGDATPAMLRASAELQRRPSFVAFTITTHRSGEGG